MSAPTTPAPMADASAVVGRRELHSRQIAMTGYLRDDGLYEIEGHVLDRKTHPFQTDKTAKAVLAGAPIHNMWVKLVYDENMLIHDVAARTDDAPYTDCLSAAQSLQCLRGLVMSSGWSKELRARLAGAKGCTHLTQLLQPMATTAFQTLSQTRQGKPFQLDQSGRPKKIDSCWAYASDRAVVAMRWPEHAKLARKALT
jgi:hypothetical protein